MCIKKQLLNLVFHDIQNHQGLGKCYQPKPDNTYLALDNSVYHERPHPIIVYNQHFIALC